MKTEQEVKQEVKALRLLIRQSNAENDTLMAMYYCGMVTILKEWILK